MRAVLRFLLRLLVILLLLAVLVLAGFRLAAVWREGESRGAAMPAEGRRVATSMGGIYIEEAGPADGPVVLLVHGSVGWARLWQPTLGVLAAEGWRAIALDMPPMGYSDLDPQNRYDRARQGARIRALVQALGVRPVLVAHSFGAGAAAEAMMSDPNGFAGLVVIAGAIGLERPAGPPPLPLRAQWLREVAVAASVANPLALGRLLRAFLHREEAATPEVIAVLARPLSLEGYTPALAHWLPTLLSPPEGAASVREAHWRGLAGRVGFIWGAEDRATPPAQGARLAALTGAGFEVMPGVGHIPQLEDPAGFHARLLERLAVFDPRR